MTTKPQIERISIDQMPRRWNCLRLKRWDWLREAFADFLRDLQNDKPESEWTEEVLRILCENKKLLERTRTEVQNLRRIDRYQDYVPLGWRVFTRSSPLHEHEEDERYYLYVGIHKKRAPRSR